MYIRCFYSVVYGSQDRTSIFHFTLYARGYGNNNWSWASLEYLKTYIVKWTLNKFSIFYHTWITHGKWMSTPGFCSSVIFALCQLYILSLHFAKMAWYMLHVYTMIELCRDNITSCYWNSLVFPSLVPTYTMVL